MHCFQEDGMTWFMHARGLLNHVVNHRTTYRVTWGGMRPLKGGVNHQTTSDHPVRSGKQGDRDQ